MAKNNNGSSHLMGAGEQVAIENFLVKKFGKSQTEEILREKLQQENAELKRELTNLRPLPA